MQLIFTVPLKRRPLYDSQILYLFLNKNGKLKAEIQLKEPVRSPSVNCFISLAAISSYFSHC